MTSRSLEGPLTIGENFLGKYEIVKLIGRGGNACVYEALHRFMGKRVAIKVLHRPGGLTREALQRGQAEAQLMNAIRHQHIVEVSDAGLAEEGLLYIVMELLEGRNLRETLNELGTLTVEETLLICAQIAEGTHAAHLAGAIHRDLKPDNAFITGNNRVKVLDFGVMKLVDAAAWSTQKGIAHGTPLYMSPEQLHLRPVGPASDIYTLGLILYESLVGRHPVYLLTDTMSPTLWEIGRVAANMDPPRVDEVDPRIPEEVGKLVECALAKAPQKRFPNMKDFAGAMLQARVNWLAYAHRQGIPILERDLSRPRPSPRDASGAGDQPDTEPVARPMFLGALSSTSGMPEAAAHRGSPADAIPSGPHTEILNEPPPPPPAQSRKESHGPRPLAAALAPTSTLRVPGSPTPLGGVEQPGSKARAPGGRALYSVAAIFTLLGIGAVAAANLWHGTSSAPVVDKAPVSALAPAQPVEPVAAPEVAAPRASEQAPPNPDALPSPAESAAAVAPPRPSSALGPADSNDEKVSLIPLGPASATRPPTAARATPPKSAAAKPKKEDDLEALLQKTEQKLQQDEKKRKQPWIK